MRNYYVTESFGKFIVIENDLGHLTTVKTFRNRLKAMAYAVKCNDKGGY